MTTLQRTKLLPLQKRAIPVNKFVYVKNINKLQHTEEEIATFAQLDSLFS